MASDGGEAKQGMEKTDTLHKQQYLNRYIHCYRNTKVGAWNNYRAPTRPPQSGPAQAACVQAHV